MIECNVSEFSYANRVVLAPLALRLQRGETLCILGPSGCGKTTLLSVLAGLNPQARVSWHSARPEIGYLFQQPRLLPWRTLKQNLLLVEPDQSRVLNMLDAVNLSDYVDYYPTRISLGMARRAALARCLLLQPELVLMDEPLVSLDPPTARQMRGLIQQLIGSDPDRCLIYVTHDLDEALEMGDHVVVLGNAPSEVVLSAPCDQLNKAQLEQILDKPLRD
jgi:NitT/TauT family transport system ATP-binding protein